MKSFAISVAFIFISCLGFAQSRQFLLAGQSNARGRGDATLSPIVDPMTSYEYHPTLDTLLQLADPVGVNSGGFQQAANGSAWPAFGKTYYEMTGDTTVMIPAARGGSGVHPISASSGANWSANGLLYSLCKFKIDEAMLLTDLPLDGIVWVQGEQDAARITFGAYGQDDYRDALIELIDRFRGDYGCAVPFYMVLLGANTEDPAEGYDAVRAAQAEVAAIHPHTYVVHENAVNFPGLGWMSDNVHYTQDGYNEIGVVGATNIVDIERTYYKITSSTTDTICPGDNVMLSAPPMYTNYQWSNGDTGQSIFVTEGGEYTVMVTDTSGCTFPLHSTKVSAYPEQIRPSISLSANDTICVGEILTLTASSPEQNYLWSTGETTASITVDNADDFFVQTIDTNGCLSLPSDTISTTVISLSVPIITSNNLSSIVCEGDNTVLSAPSGFDTYLWSNGETTQSITVTDSGSYSCTIGQAHCLSEPSAFVAITVIATPPMPTITWSGSTNFCEGDSVILTASAELDRYIWSTGDTTQRITVYDSGIYSCIFIGENDCEGMAASPIFITENPLPQTPNVTVVGNTALCEGDDLVLNAPQGFDTYEWSNGESTQSITISTAGTYDVTVTDSNGCQSAPSTPITTTINPLPPAPIISTDGPDTFCEGDSVILTATAGFTSYQWSNGENTPSITAYDTNSYFCIVTDANGCISPVSAPTNTIAVPAPPVPQIAISGSTTFCEGDSVVLAAPFGFLGYQWSSGQTTQNITVYDSGIYNVFVINNNNCQSPVSAPVVLTSISPDTSPLISINGTTTLCEGESAVLTAPSGSSAYLWSNGAVTQGITVTTSGIFTCIITSADGCESLPSNPIAITVNPRPTTPLITPNNSTTFCEGDEVILSAPNGFTDYLWSNGETTQSITVSTSGTFDVIVTDANDCQSAPSVPITTILNSVQTPNISAQSSTTFCEGDSVILTAPSGFSTYLWSNGETTQSITVVGSGTFDIIVTDANGCESMPSAPIITTVISVASEPTITISGTTMLCQGENVVLTAPSNLFGYLWSNGATTQSITVSTAGTYICIITSPNDCESPPSAPIEVSVNPLPAMPIITSNTSTTFCEGDSVILTATAGFADYLWSTGETTQSITVSTSGTFEVMVIDANGCESPLSQAITTNVNTISTPSIIAQSSTTFCEGESVTLTAPAGFTYLWSNGETTQNIIVTDSGTFGLIVTDANGCESIPSASITTTTISPTTAPIITTNGNTNICEGESVTLSAPVGFANYLWSNGAISQDITVSTSGTFTCEITSTNGCPSPPSEPITVTVNPLPTTPSIIANDVTTFCDGESVILSAPAGFPGYEWSNGETTQSIIVTNSGTYNCIVIDANGCTSPTSAFITTTVNPIAAPTVITSGATTFCEGESVTLSTTSEFASYLWSNGETTQSISVTDSGTYDVVITNADGCISTASEPVNVIALSVDAAPELTLNGTATFCNGESLTISAPSGFSGYLWSTGETTSSIIVTTSGTFICETINTNGCESAPSEPIVVTVNSLPATPTITNNTPTTFCEGDSVILSAPNGFDNYLWSNGETTQNITLTNSGVFDVMVMDENGCQSPVSAPIEVMVNTLPTAPEITASGSTTFCDSDSVILSAPAGFLNYEWSNGETTQSITVFDSGNYDVFVTNISGCLSANSTPINVTVNALPTAPELIASSPTTFCDGDNVILSAPTGFDTYEWSNGAMTQSITVHDTGTFNCLVSDANGCVSSVSASLDVVVNELPPIPQLIANGETEFCEGDSVTISAPLGFDSYLWSNGETTQDITVSIGGSYDLTITNANGCSSASDISAKVIVNPLPAEPIIQAVGASVFCEGDSVTLVVPGGFSTYLWSTGEITQDITVSETGAFYCTVTDTNGCENASAGFSTVVNESLPVPQITFSGETEFCEGGSVTLFAPSGYFYLWSNGATTQDITLTETSSPLSCVIMDANGCMSEASEEAFVKVFPLPPAPTIDTVGSTNLCLGNTVELSVSGSFDSYIWSNGETTQSISVGVSGNYSVTVFNEDGCDNESATSVNVSVNPTPLQPTISVGGSTNFCEGESVTLSAPNAPGYLWSNGETTQSIIVSETGSFYCIILDEFDCQSQPSVTVSTLVFDLPDSPVISLSDDAILCPGDTVILSAEPGFATYFWSNGSVSDKIIATENGEYSYVVLDDNGCQSAPSETVTIEVRPLPPLANIHSTNDFNFCEGDSITLEADADYRSYLWSTGETDSIITVNRADEFFYVADDGFSCEDAVSVSVTTGINPPPPISTIEQIEIDTLCASQAADRYLWYRNDTLTSFTTRCISPELNGDWRVVGIVDGCLSEFSMAYEYTGRPPIDPNAPAGMNVFPNPAVGNFITIQTINIPEDAATLDIYDVLGRLLYRRQLDIQKLPRYEIVINIERLPDAVYVAVIDAGFSGRYVQKFVVDD